MTKLLIYTATCNEFRSDTFTVPSLEMIEMLLATTFGDSVYNEDQTTLDLEKMVATLAGKPAALFCVSGTLSNQIGLRTNLIQPPYLVLCDYRSHVFLHEAGGLATLSQAMVHPVIPANGNYLTLEDILCRVVPDDGSLLAAPTKVISLENTLHGMIMPITEIERISQYARANDIRMHLDGARLWNAHVTTGVLIAEYCSHFDSVSLCLSKSLGAPIGLILVGQASFIAKANHFRKQMGGGIRQSGPIASMAIYAIEHNIPLIAKSHLLAKKVGDFCTAHGIHLTHPVDSNFVFVDFAASKMDEKYFIRVASEQYNIKVMGGRFAFHFQLNDDSVDRLIQALGHANERAKTQPFTATKYKNSSYYS